MQGVRAYLASIDRPAADLVAAVDAFDPDRRARVIGSQFLRAGEVAGRPVYGGRSASWAALEDKTIIDDLWDQAGVSRAPSEIVSVADAPAAAIDFLRREGYTVTPGGRPGDCSVYLDDLAQFGEVDEKPLAERLGQLQSPLLRYWRWPDRARCALSVTGDIDSITLIDFALRIWENWRQRL